MISHIKTAALFLVAVCSALLIPGIQDVVAQQAGCTVRDRSKAIAIVICPAGLEQAKLREAGEAACVGLMSCSAWIWDNAALAPRAAPALATGIAKDAILNSVAIWDQDGKQLVMISKVK